MHQKYQISDGKLLRTEGDQAPVQVYVNPDESERRYLIDELKIDEHTLFSALDPDELPRMEFEPDHAALIYKRPKSYSANDQFLFKVASTGIFIYKDRLIIVLAEEVPLFDGKLFTRVTTLNGLMLRLIYQSIYHFREHLKIIQSISDDLQTKINTSMENSHLLNMFVLEKSLVYYVNSLNSNGLLMEKLKSTAARTGMNTDELEMIDDILIENNQCYRQADIYSNILASLMDARASIVSNNLNVLMKTLNIITIMIMVPTFVVSAFSMNVTIPLEKHPYAFYIIMGLALTSVLAFTLYWRHRRW